MKIESHSIYGYKGQYIKYVFNINIKYWKSQCKILKFRMAILAVQKLIAICRLCVWLISVWDISIYKLFLNKIYFSKRQVFRRQFNTSAEKIALDYLLGLMTYKIKVFGPAYWIRHELNIAESDLHFKVK